MKKIKKFVRRPSEPIMSLSEFDDTKRDPKARRKSEGVIKVPETIIENSPKPMPYYYFQGLDREGAESLLKNEAVGTFLVRDRQSSTLPGSYTMSLRDKNDAYRHYRIETNPRNKKLVIQTYQDSQFDSLESLVEFFSKRQKNFDVPLKPYVPGDKNDDMYEEMDENNTDLYQEMGPAPDLPPPSSPSHLQCYENVKNRGDAPAPPSPNSPLPPRLPPKNLSQAYQNLPGRNLSPTQVEHDEHYKGPKGGYRLPPPPPTSGETSTNEYENVAGKNKTLPPDFKYPNQPGDYENMPGKDEPLPLPPKPQPPMTGTGRGRRKSSLPTTLEGLSSNQGKPPPLPTRPRGSGQYQNLPGKGTSRPPLRRAQTTPE